MKRNRPAQVRETPLHEEGSSRSLYKSVRQSNCIEAGLAAGGTRLVRFVIVYCPTSFCSYTEP